MSANNEFKPYIPADRVLPELSVVSIVLGVLLAVLFGGANAYLGLRVGMTVSASIPAAVISMGVIRMLLRRDSILENNIVQTIGSAGESVAAGAIFTLPAVFMWADEGGTAAPTLTEIALITLAGGLLGVLFMIPLRSALIVKEHGVLPYPEGQACAKVLLAGESGGAKAGTVFAGLGISAVYKFLADGLKAFPSEVDIALRRYRGAGIGMDVLPALLGVGYICGARISSYLLAGGTVGWFVLMPLIALFGGDSVIFPAAEPVSMLDTWALWKNYIRYIGAGAVACGGILSLIKTLPMIVRTFHDSVRGLRAGRTEAVSRTQREIGMKAVLAGIAAVAVVMWLVPAIPVNLAGALIIVICGFFFATVSARMVGLVGSSNNPVSGMAIATLLIATILLKSGGMTGYGGMVSAIAVGTVICIIAAVAGDTSQDLKTGYLIGSTPKHQQIGELIGVTAAALAIGAVLYLFNTAWSYGSTELPAPQAMLMKMVVEGVMGGDLPWDLVFVGVAVAVVAEILGIPVLPFAVGLYLPIHLSTPMMAGGIVRWFFERKGTRHAAGLDRGVLYASGLIAGEGLVGILLAVLSIIKHGNGSVADAIALPTGLGNIGGLLAFALLCATLVFVIGAETTEHEASESE